MYDEISRKTSTMTTVVKAKLHSIRLTIATDNDRDVRYAVLLVDLDQDLRRQMVIGQREEPS